MAHPQALVYRGPAACDGCPEAVANLLRSSPSHFHVKYAGPNEDVKITSESLSKVDVYAQPGGPDWHKAARQIEPYADTIRGFVENGGRYMGFCLGAYLAGHPGLNMLPPGDNAGQEILQKDAEVKSGKNTIIQVDWQFSTGPLAGKTEKRWVFFQDGAVMKLPNMTDSKILGRYASNQDIAAALTPYGRGWVGTTGPHPEADKTWYTYGFQNPDGINFEIGHDFVETTTRGL